MKENALRDCDALLTTTLYLHAVLPFIYVKILDVSTENYQLTDELFGFKVI